MTFVSNFALQIFNKIRIYFYWTGFILFGFRIVDTFLATPFNYDILIGLNWQISK